MTAVTQPSPSYLVRRGARGLALAASAALVLAGCGSTESTTSPVPKVSLPTQSVSAPAGVTLTKTGTRVAFGGSATVGFAPNGHRSTALKITVRKVVKGSISDLRGYDLDPRAASSRPYYARVTVQNVGTGDVGRSAIPLWGLAADDTLIGSTGFTNAFDRCPSKALPTRFGAGAKSATCLMYLVPKSGRLVGISYRPVMADSPIVWKGTITSPAKAKAEKKAQQKKAQKKAQKKKAQKAPKKSAKKKASS